MDTAGGRRTPPPPPAGPDRRSASSPRPMTWPLVPVHIASLSNGKVAVWDGFDAALNSERIWDPATGTFDAMPTGRNLFCAGHVTARPTGGCSSPAATERLRGHRRTPHLSTRRRARGPAAPDMSRGALVPDGHDAARRPRAHGLRRQHHAQGAEPAHRRSRTVEHAARDLRPDDEHVDRRCRSVQRRMPLYPFMFVLPDGSVVRRRPGHDHADARPSTPGSGRRSAPAPIDGHSAVMYRPGKILKSGTWADPDFPDRVGHATAPRRST